ncbi:MAG: hypothetical protein JW969_18145 [Spirochaetales bacterium]|nr:hypothetical protein [Spirochaetales bacterium]
MENENPEFIKCINCGKYINRENSMNEKFCSEDCARHYSVCEVCGRYFIKTEGFDETTCTKACSVKYKLKKNSVLEKE